MYGPRFMSSRTALSLRWFIVLYNLVCAGLNLYISVELYITQKNMTYRYINRTKPGLTRIDKELLSFLSVLSTYVTFKHLLTNTDGEINISFS